MAFAALAGVCYLLPRVWPPEDQERHDRPAGGDPPTSGGRDQPGGLAARGEEVCEHALQPLCGAGQACQAQQCE